MKRLKPLQFVIVLVCLLGISACNEIIVNPTNQNTTEEVQPGDGESPSDD